MLANSIIPDLGHLSDSRKGLMVAVPLLGGSLLRLVLGPLADHIGARKTAMLGLALTVIPLLMGWLWADSYPKVLLLGLMLGVAGASFAAALPLASRWYPPQFQGLVLGIVGAGNGGTALATLFGPWVAATWGWHAAFGLALIPVLATLALFALLAKDSPSHPAPKTLADYAAVLRIADAGWFCLFYAITFGGFVGLVSFLGIFFRDQYGADEGPGRGLRHALRHQRLTAPPPGRLPLRPVRRRPGAALALSRHRGDDDGRVGHAPPGPLHPAAHHGPVAAGDGQRRRLPTGPPAVPQGDRRHHRDRRRRGGARGFVLPTLLGSLRQWTHSYFGGFLAFALIGSTGAVALAFVSRSWEGTFLGKGGVVLAGPTAGRVEVLTPLAEEAAV